MALLATLWVLAVLLVLAATFTLQVRTDVVLAGSYVRRSQAAWLAEAGLQRAFVELQQSPDTFTYLDETSDGSDALVLRLDSTDEDELQMSDGRFVVSGFDESALINLNAADEELLNTLLPEEPELVDGILDWRDSDTDVRQSGAESDYYATLEEPYRSRDAPFETIEELLLLRDVTPARLFGGDRLSPLADTEDVGEADPELTPLSDLFTTTSYDQNLDAQGTERLDLRTASEEELQEEFGEILTPEQIQSIIQYRDRETDQTDAAGAQDGAPQQSGSLGGEALAGALSAEEQAALAQAQEQLGPTATGGEAGGAAGQQAEEAEDLSVAGLVTVLDRDALRQIWDRLSGTDTERFDGRINLNTASAEVLASLPGMDASLADLIVNDRQTEPYQTVADLLRLAEIDDQTFQDLADLFTTRSLVFRLRAEGTVGEGNDALSNSIEALVLVELGGSGTEEETTSAGTTTEEGEPPQRSLRLVYRRME